MNNTMLVAALAGMGAIVGFWGQIKSLAERIISYVIGNVTIESGWSYNAATYYCFSKLKRSPIGPRTYSAFDSFVKPLNRQQIVGFEQIGNEICLFWHGWRPIWVNVADKEGYSNKLKMSYIRGTFNADKLMIDILDHFNKASNRGLERFKITYIFGAVRSHGAQDGPAKKHVIGQKNGYVFSNRYLKWGEEELGHKNYDGSAIGSLALSNEVKQCFEEAKFWKGSEDWYVKHNIPWKRGWLIHGQPGTGKTSLARAVAEELDLPVFVFDLPSMTNEELRQAWNDMLRSIPCMALFEDIDGVFKGRENIAAKDRLMGSLSFDCLLNCIDGIERTDGLFTIITTNKTEHIDAALAIFAEDGSIKARPGRIDRVIALNVPERAGLEKICKRVLSEYPELQEKTVNDGVAAKDTGAQFQERCSRTAIDEHFKTLPAMPHRRMQRPLMPKKPVPHRIRELS